MWPHYMNDCIIMRVHVKVTDHAIREIHALGSAVGGTTRWAA